MISGVSNVWVPVSDMERALAFYRDRLGLTVKEDQQPDWAELDADGVRIGLNGRESAGGSTDGGAVITFHSDAIEDDRTRLIGEGVSFTGEVSSYDWGSVAPFKDSEGNDLQLFQHPKG